MTNSLTQCAAANNCNCGTCSYCVGQKMSSFSGDGTLSDSTRFVALNGSGNAAQNVTFTLAQIASAITLNNAGNKRATFDADAATEDLQSTLGPRNIFACVDSSASRALIISTSTIIQGTITTPVYIEIKDEDGNAGTNPIVILTEGSQLIDGAGSLNITADYGSVQLYSNGTNLFTVAP